MIVVVEGPSAAGKTTWAQHAAAENVVPEDSDLYPPAHDAEEIAQFWIAANIVRWNSALQMESKTGLAVCDTDPMKLHHDFCMARIGLKAMEFVSADARAHRDAMTRQKIGFADVVLCSIPTQEVLAHRQQKDLTRRRRNFALHAQFAAPLGEWYGTLGQLDPDRVIWGLPLSMPVISMRERYDIGLFDAWMDLLGINL